MEQTGTQGNQEAQNKDNDRDTDNQIGDNVTKTIARITIHGRKRTVTFRGEQGHGKKSRKLKGWNQDHGDAGEKEMRGFSLWLKRLSSKMRRGMKTLFGHKQQKRGHKNHHKRQRKQRKTKKCRISKQK